MKLDDAAHLPAPQQLSGKRRGVLEERHLVNKVDDGHVAAVKTGWSPEDAVVKGIVDLVATARGVVLALRERIGNAKTESIAETAVGADLEPIVFRTGCILAEVDEGEAAEGPQEIGVKTGVGRIGASAWLQRIQLAHSFEVLAHPADIGNRNGCVETDFAFQCGIPVVRRRYPKYRIDGREKQRELCLAGAAGIVDEPVRDRNLRLKRCIAAEEDVVTDSRPREEAAEAAAQNGLGVDLVGDSYARREVQSVEFRGCLLAPAEQPVELSRVRARDTPSGGFVESRAGNDHAVERIAAAGNDVSSCGVQLDRLGGVECVSTENRNVPPLTEVVGLDQVMTNADFALQAAVHSPGVLGEPTERVGAIRREGAVANLGEGGEQAQSSIADSESGASGTVIREYEASVLIVGPTWDAGDVDLVKVILSLSIERGAELEGVIPLDVGQVVGDLVNGAGRRRRIRAAVDRYEVVDVDGWNLVGNLFPLGWKDIREIDSEAASLERSIRLDVDEHAIHAGGDQDFVDRVGTDGQM